MGPRTRSFVIALAGLVVVSPLLLGGGGTGADTGIYPTPALSDVTSPTSPCIETHTYAWRAWGSFQIIRSDVELIACRNAAGELSVLSAPTCTATSFLGPGTATCVATRAGSNIHVQVHVEYPFGLSLIAGAGQPSGFTVHPDGGYFSP